MGMQVCVDVKTGALSGFVCLSDKYGVEECPRESKMLQGPDRGVG
jgi:hypothetical protein